MPKVTAIILFIVGGLLLMAGAAVSADAAHRLAGIYLLAAGVGFLLHAALFASLAEILSCLRESRDGITRPQDAGPPRRSRRRPSAPEGEQVTGSPNIAEPGWRVTGVEKETGIETSIVVEARSRPHAREVAQDRGLSKVTTIEELM